MAQRVLAVLTDAVQGEEAVEALTGPAAAEEVELRLVLPAVEESPLRHGLGDVDGPAQDAQERLETSLRELHRRGLSASGEVGDADPVLAAQDALREAPADEVVFFEHAPGEARWFEKELVERAQTELETPIRVVMVETAERRDPHVVSADGAAAASRHPEEAEVEISGNLPRFSRADLGGIVIGIVGSLVAAILAAAVAAGGSTTLSGASAVAVLVAIGISLVNMAHVVGLTLFESVRYRGGWESFFHTFALIATPLAVLVNLAILLFA